MEIMPTPTLFCHTIRQTKYFIVPIKYLVQNTYRSNLKKYKYKDEDQAQQQKNKPDL